MENVQDERGRYNLYGSAEEAAQAAEQLNMSGLLLSNFAIAYEAHDYPVLGKYVINIVDEDDEFVDTFGPDYRYPC
jgi:hypothetical protein